MIGYLKSLKLSDRFGRFFSRQAREAARRQTKIAVLEHHLRLFGLQEFERVQIQYGGIWRDVDAELKGGNVVVILEPSTPFLKEGGIGFKKEPPGVLKLDKNTSWGALRTLHETLTFYHSKAEGIARTEAGSLAWIKFRVLGGTLFVLGSDVAGDLIRYRQGDPAAARKKNKAGALWGFNSERPVYLFEDQLKDHQPGERAADVIAMALATEISTALGQPLSPLLPGDAPGAIVITGDDDQAELEKYEEQLEILGNLPITYFLHPKTRHTQETIRSMLGSSEIDLGLHPDALESPARYGRLLRKQVAWFEALVGLKPESIRNHGFLNDGYWGHLRFWKKEGVKFSSNLPGLNGRILNGSLLPARVAIDNELTDHWSILTAIGDGVVFVLKLNDKQSHELIQNLASSIRASGIPGLIVVNLHPQNISETRSMHLALKELVGEGFLAWNMSQCLNWFLARDSQGVEKND